MVVAGSAVIQSIAVNSDTGSVTDLIAVSSRLPGCALRVVASHDEYIHPAYYLNWIERDGNAAAVGAGAAL
jgi:hypothetical protein